MIPALITFFATALVMGYFIHRATTRAEDAEAEAEELCAAFGLALDDMAAALDAARNERGEALKLLLAANDRADAAEVALGHSLLRAGGVTSLAAARAMRGRG